MGIRLATMQDIPILVDLYHQARLFMRAHGNQEQWADGHPKEEDLTEDIAKKQLYVYEYQGQIEGAFVFFIGKDPTYQIIENGHWLNDETYGVVHKVASRQRIHGVGHKILTYVFSQIKNVRMDTHADNYPMQKLLEKHGFVHVGTIYLADGQSRLAYQHTGNIERK